MTEPTKTPALTEYSGAALAYLGDAVMEVLVRRMLVGRGIGNAGKLSALSLDYVRATNQSRGLEGLLSHLTEEETAVAGVDAELLEIHRARAAADEERAKRKREKESAEARRIPDAFRGLVSAAM